VAVQCAQINRPARPAARTKDVEPGRPGEERGPDCRRPQHVAAGGQSPIPAVDNKLGLGARSRAGLDVEPSCPIAPVSRRGARKSILLKFLRTPDPDHAASPVLAGSR
jgi:hypothetical protein